MSPQAPTAPSLPERSALPELLALRARAEGWPRLLDVRLVHGTLKAMPEDFEVEEIPAYTPCGEGDFAYLWIEKRDVGWKVAREQLARALHLPPDEIGFAGIKDKRAVTRQYISLPRSAEVHLPHLTEIPGLRVLSASRHTNKLRTGHLRGNRFTVRITAMQPADVTLAQRAAELLCQGVPNYYGEQRFGRDLRTLELGWMTLLGASRSRDKFRTKLAISALQSALFNDCLAARVQDGLLFRAILGDVMSKTTTGGLFVCSQPEVDQERLDAGEIVPTGPIFGKKTFAPAAEQARREDAVLERAGIAAASLASLGKLAPGTRRPLLVRPEGLEAHAGDNALTLSFSLPAGAYATVVLRELLASPDGAEGGSELDG